MHLRASNRRRGRQLKTWIKAAKQNLLDPQIINVIGKTALHSAAKFMWSKPTMSEISYSDDDECFQVHQLITYPYV